MPDHVQKNPHNMEQCNGMLKRSARTPNMPHESVDSQGKYIHSERVCRLFDKPLAAAVGGVEGVHTALRLSGTFNETCDVVEKKKKKGHNHQEQHHPLCRDACSTLFFDRWIFRTLF